MRAFHLGWAATGLPDADRRSGAFRVGSQNPGGRPYRGVDPSGHEIRVHLFGQIGFGETPTWQAWLFQDGTGLLRDEYSTNREVWPISLDGSKVHESRRDRSAVDRGRRAPIAPGDPFRSRNNGPRHPGIAAPRSASTSWVPGQRMGLHQGIPWGIPGSPGRRRTGQGGLAGDRVPVWFRGASIHRGIFNHTREAWRAEWPATMGWWTLEEQWQIRLLSRDIASVAVWSYPQTGGSRIPPALPD